MFDDFYGSATSSYRTAAVCRRGHVETTIAEGHPVPARCGECGAVVLTACESCRAPIRGYYHVPGVVGFDPDYKPADFCHQCAAPMPWLSRQGRVYQLQNLLDDEQDIDPATGLRVRELLDELLADPDGEDEPSRWLAISKKVPAFWERSGVRAIVTTIATEEAKKRLGL